jgi:cell division protein FtsQ
VVALAAVLTWLVAFSPVLGVRTVAVRGAGTLSADQVRAAAGIRTGTPLIRLDSGAVAHRVESLPGVRSATVTTSYPSTVVITVDERVAVGVLKSGTGFVLVDATGAQFRSVAERPAALPLFDVPAGADARATGQAVATVAAALPAQLRAQVASIQALDPEAVTLLMTDRRIVRWGSADRSADKARILPALLARPATQVDLTDPDMPFTR